MAARPTILIAALKRTGSKLVSSALTELPETFIFREPRLFRAKIDLKEGDLQEVAGHGLDLTHLPLRRRFRDPVAAAASFREEVLDPAGACLRQVGLKEIRYGPRWRGVVAQLEPVRVIILARDPRDMYLSLAGRLARNGRLALRGEFGPDAVAADLRREYDIQREMIDELPHLRVRYEDLCTDPRVIDEVRRYVDSPLTGAPDLGLFAEQGNDEIHGAELTSLRVGRWRTEADPAVASAAQAVATKLSDYCDFWGYDV